MMATLYTLQFDGLEKIKRGENEELHQKFNATITLPAGSSMQDVWNALRGQGFKTPYAVDNGSSKFSLTSTKRKDLSHDKIKVVAGDATSEFEINVNETFKACANRQYGKHVEFNIGDVNSEDPKRPKQLIKDDRGLNISFQRTPRMPDDNKLHQLPGSLGSYNLFNVEAYADRLPANIRDTGGVFLPMWQREAMWISFEVNSSRRMETASYALRVFVGKINAVSGLQMDEDPAKADLDSNQDYVVVPGQRWLDGICVAPGVVRQFVAMPLGSGYTVEGQKTSEEKYGGLQIEVIPQYQSELRIWVTDGNVNLKSSHIGEMKTPADVGLSPGDFVRSYPSGEKEQIPCTIDDMVENGTAAYAAEYRNILEPRVKRVKAYSTVPILDDYFQPSSSDNGPLSTDSIGSTADFDFDSISEWTLQSAGTVKGTPPTVTEPKSLNHKYDSYKQQTGFMNSAPPPAVHFFDADLKSTMDMTFDFKGLDKTPPHSLPEDIQTKSQSNDTEDDKLDIDIVTTDLKAMGLAAGGKLVQDIYKDNYPSDTWNHAAARIINIHILDPASCEKVTHIVPLPPPEDAKSYAEKGGQFFVVEEQVDNRVDGGDFDGVKSVSQMDKHIGVNKEDEFDPTKPSMCKKCKMRLTDCIVRPCNHQFCNLCIKDTERKCPTCQLPFSHVAGFSAPMNLPGEEPVRMKVPVNVLEINDGRVRFKGGQTTRI